MVGTPDAERILEGEQMKPVQPYFVLATDQYYEAPVMRDGIASLYHYRRNCRALERIHAIPDGCIDVYFERDCAGIHARVCGTVRKSTPVPMKNGNEYFGIRFLPGVLPANLNAQMKDFVERRVDLEDVAQSRSLVWRIEQAKDWRQCVGLFLEAYEATRREPGSCQEKLAVYVTQQMLSARGGIRIQELAQKSGYSARYIATIFEQYVGISPKTLERIIQFQNAVHSISYHQARPLTEVGVEAGYFDQAHFIREFKKHMGLTPNEYRKLVREQAYLTHFDVSPPATAP